MRKKKWKNYEKVAVFLLNKICDELGLEKVEGKQKIKGKSGVKWEIDGKGIKINDEGIIVIECRRYTNSKQSQDKLGSLAYTINDIGAKGGIIISPLGIQEGAKKIANVENIISIKLDQNTTKKKYILEFLNKIMAGFTENMSLSMDLASIEWEEVNN